MTIAVAGATGKAGREIALHFASLGEDVLALCRDSAKVQLLPSTIKKIIVDYKDHDSLYDVLQGCEGVINAIGIPEQYLYNKNAFYEINVSLATQLFKIAESCRVKNFLHISTADVFEPGRHFLINEEQPMAQTGRSPYVDSKIIAETHLKKLALSCDMKLVIVNPSGIFGPGPIKGSIDAGFLQPILKRKLAFIPPGSMSLVYGKSFASGALQAYLLGKENNNYLFCDATLSTAELSSLLTELGGLKHPPKQVAPTVALLVANLSEWLARYFKIKPILSKGEINYLLADKQLDISKAHRELHWSPMPLPDSLAAYIDCVAKD